MVRRSPTRGRSVHGDRPAPLLLRTHPHQINACPHTLPGLLSHSSQHRHSCKTQHPQSKERCRGTELDRSIFALLCGERSTRTWRRTVNRRGNRIENLPFDSTMSPSRSSRLSPAPTKRQNTAGSWISSAWLPSRFGSAVCLVCGSAITVCFTRLAVSV